MRFSKDPFLPFLGLLALTGCSSEADGGSVQIAPIDGCESCQTSDASPAGPAPSSMPGLEDDGGTPGMSSPTPAKASDSDRNTCAMATDLGTIAGEIVYNGASPLEKSAQDHCSKWFKIRVSETSKLPASLAVQATLVSPKSTKFDLYAYVDKKDDSLACITPSASSASTLGSVDHVELDWSDNWFGNDSRTVAIEVRSRNGSCDASSTWSLLVSNVDHSAKGF